MSEKPTAATTEKPHRSRLQKIKRTAAALTATASFGGLAAAPAYAQKAVPKKAGVEHVQPGQLKNPSELPGIKIHLGKEILDQLKSSTVEIALRPRPDLPGGSAETTFSPFCTAVRVQVPGETGPVFATAAHCFSQLTNAKSGALEDYQNPLIKAENFTALSQEQYAIIDPSEPALDERLAQPVAIIDQISISTDDKDIALLHAKEYAPQMISSPNIRSLSEIPALPLAGLKKKPVPGTPVAMYGVPAASGFLARGGTGVYIDRIAYQYQDALSGKAVTRQLDLVGITADSPVWDKCNFGSSGSVAELPNGQILGNLSARINWGYGPDHYMQLDDAPYQNDMYWLSNWENQTGVDMSGFTTICGYTVINAKTPAQLVAGFNNPAPGEGAG